MKTRRRPTAAMWPFLPGLAASLRAEAETEGTRADASGEGEVPGRRARVQGLGWEAKG